MKCTDALNLISSVLDGEATDEETRLLQFHLNGCDSCSKAMEISSSISQSIKSLQEPEPPTDLLLKVRQRLASEPAMPSQSRKTLFNTPSWKIAAAIPFAAAILLLLNGGGESAAVVKPMADSSSEQVTRYTPAPVVAYSRPSSVTTF